MDIKECILYDNDCYKTYAKINPIGVCIHSTDANQKYLKRWVQPSKTDPNYDNLMEVLGKNIYSNSWNRGGVQKCVTFMVGCEADGQTVVAYRTLPEDCRPWGVGGKGNDLYLQFEMLESYDDPEYFEKQWTVTIDLVVYLCKKYGWTSKDIVTHDWCGKNGLGSGHTDPVGYFKRYGKTVDQFKEEVQKILDYKEPEDECKEWVLVYEDDDTRLYKLEDC